VDVRERLVHLLDQQRRAPLAGHTRRTLNLGDDASERPLAALYGEVGDARCSLAAIMIKSATIIAPPAGLCPTNLGAENRSKPAR
jgi:hypothetical protein